MVMMMMTTTMMMTTMTPMQKKEVKKVLKYKDLTTQIKCMWHVKTKVIPVIIGAK
jgi:lysophospholipid acyltransferase (LPLAT)-like uncharacterized protein